MRLPLTLSLSMRVTMCLPHLMGVAGCLSLGWHHCVRLLAPTSRPSRRLRRVTQGRPLSMLDGVLVAIKDEIDAVPFPTVGGTKWMRGVRRVDKVRHTSLTTLDVTKEECALIQYPADALKVEADRSRTGG